MKRIISWIGVLVFVLILSIILFITGQKHKVLLSNGKRGQEVPKKVAYIIDKQKKKTIKAHKKGATYIKGRNHTIIISFENEDGKEVKIEKKFKTKSSSNVIINFYDIINNSNKWIKYKK